MSTGEGNEEEEKAIKKEDNGPREVAIEHEQFQQRAQPPSSEATIERVEPTDLIREDTKAGVEAAHENLSEEERSDEDDHLVHNNNNNNNNEDAPQKDPEAVRVQEQIELQAAIEESKTSIPEETLHAEAVDPQTAEPAAEESHLAEAVETQAAEPVAEESHNVEAVETQASEQVVVESHHAEAVQTHAAEPVAVESHHAEDVETQASEPVVVESHHAEAVEIQASEPVAAKTKSAQELYEEINGISIEIVEPRDCEDNRSDGGDTVSSVDTIVATGTAQGRRGSLVKENCVDFGSKDESEETRPRRGSVIVSNVETVANQIVLEQDESTQTVTSAYQQATFESATHSSSHSSVTSSAHSVEEQASKAVFATSAYSSPYSEQSYATIYSSVEQSSAQSSFTASHSTSTEQQVIEGAVSSGTADPLHSSSLQEALLDTFEARAAEALHDIAVELELSHINELHKTEESQSISVEASAITEKSAESSSHKTTSSSTEISTYSEERVYATSHHHVTTSSNQFFQLDGMIPSPRVIVEEAHEEAKGQEEIEDDVVVVRQYDYAPSPIKEITLHTSYNPDLSVEAALTLKEQRNEIHSSTASLLTIEKGELKIVKEEEQIESQSSEEAMFEEYYEEVVLHSFEEEQRRIQQKRAELLRRIEETKETTEWISERRHSYGGRVSHERYAVDTPRSYRTLDSPYSFDWRRVESPAMRSITSIREEREDSVSSHEGIYDERHETTHSSDQHHQESLGFCQEEHMSSEEQLGFRQAEELGFREHLREEEVKQHREEHHLGFHHEHLLVRQEELGFRQEEEERHMTETADTIEEHHEEEEEKSDSEEVIHYSEEVVYNYVSERALHEYAHAERTLHSSSTYETLSQSMQESYHDEEIHVETPVVEDKIEPVETKEDLHVYDSVREEIHHDIGTHVQESQHVSTESEEHAYDYVREGIYHPAETHTEEIEHVSTASEEHVYDSVHDDAEEVQHVAVSPVHTEIEVKKDIEHVTIESEMHIHHSISEETTEVHHIRKTHSEENGQVRKDSEVHVYDEVWTELEPSHVEYSEVANESVTSSADSTQVETERREEQHDVTSEISIDMNRSKIDSHLYEEISEEVIYDRVAAEYDQVHREEENVYEEIDQFGTQTEAVTVASSESTESEYLKPSRERTIQREDSGEYEEIHEEAITEKKNETKKVENVRLMEAVDVTDKTTQIFVPREPLPVPRRGKGSFVEMMKQAWDSRVYEMEEKRSSPRKIIAPRRKDFQPDELLIHVMDQEVPARPTTLDTGSVRAQVRPRSRSMNSPSPSHLLDTPSITTIRYDPVEGRSERIKDNLDEYYLGDHTVVINDGVHLKERNPYSRNAYEDHLDELIKSPELESEAQHTLHSIRLASQRNKWGEAEDADGMRPIERYDPSTLKRESYHSSPNISRSSNSSHSSSAHSHKKSVTFAPEQQLVDYCDMHEYSLHEERLNTRVDRTTHRSNDVTLLQAQDSFTRKETNQSGQSYTKHYERTENRELVSSRDRTVPIQVQHTPSPKDVQRVHQVPTAQSPVFSPAYSPVINNNNNEKYSSQSLDRSSTVSIDRSTKERSESKTSLSSLSSHSSAPLVVREAVVVAASPTPSSRSSTSGKHSPIYDSVPMESHTASIHTRRSSTDSARSAASAVSSTSTITSSQQGFARSQSHVSVASWSPPVKEKKEVAVSSESLVKNAHLVTASGLSTSSASSHILHSKKSVDSHTQTVEMRVEGEIQSNGKSIQMEDGSVSSLSQWDPTPLIRRLYEVSYEPRMETKRSRFVNMEGHVEVPNEDFEEGFERKWVPKYVKTRDGRLQFFVTHYADETPADEKLLCGAEVEILREERIVKIVGGRAHLKISLRVPSALIDKWRQALLSHAASSSIDAYVRPIPSALPHITQRVLIIELGSCSIRGGVLTSEPSLPTSFFPAVGCRLPNGEMVVGEEAYLPKNRLHGELVTPLTASDPSLETYTINRDVMRGCIKKVIQDSRVDPAKYKVLVSLSQNIPSVLIEDLMKVLLEDIRFEAAAVTRQPSLVLYAYDVSTGVVVDIGEKLSIVPVVDGYMVESGIVCLPHGGKQMQDCLRRQLADNNQGVYGQDNAIESLLLRNVMEETAFVSQDPQDESSKAKGVAVSLLPFNPLPSMPKSLQVDNCRFLATEGLFTPKKWNIEGKGLHQLIHESIQNSPIDARRVLYRNIYLAGGASLLPGLAERLETQLAEIVPNSIHSQVHISPWRYNAAFLGAQVIASSATFDDSTVSLSALPSFLTKLRNAPF